MVDRTGLHTAPVPGATPLGTAPVDGRLVQAALFGTGGQCLSGGGLTASSTTMAFTVAAGVYQIPDTANGGAVYHSPIDSAVVTPSAGQAGGRIDSLYVLQQDFEKNGSTSRVVYGLAVGTAGSGTAPSLSGIAGGPLRLANITVPSTATKATDCTVSWVVPPAALALDGAIAANKALLDLVPGTYVGQRSFAGGIDYRWNGTAWKGWDSDWFSYSAGPSGLIGAANAAPGFIVQTSDMRYRAGRVMLRGYLYLNGGGSGFAQQVYLALPVPAATQTGWKINGSVSAFRGANEWEMEPQPTSASQFTFGTRTGSGQVTPNGPTSPISWTQSDGLGWAVEYDQA